MLVRSGAHWDKTVDVLIVGYGGAGAAAAMVAQEEGADVLVLEKQAAATHHTNTSMAGGAIFSPANLKDCIKYMEAICQAGEGAMWTDKRMIKVWAEYTSTNKVWIEARGGSFADRPMTAEYPGLPGYSSMGRYKFRGLGPGLAKYLDEQVKKRKIPVMYRTAGTRLLTDLRGRVVGLEAESSADGSAKKIRIRAGKGVILTCGGFEYNERMKLNYLKVYPTYFTGTEYNTGDGVRMAQAVGADLWHMNCVSAHSVMKFPGCPIAFYVLFVPNAELAVATEIKPNEEIKRCGFVVTDKFGKRMRNEDDFRAAPPKHSYYYELASYDSKRLTYPRVPSYWIFDSRRFELGPLPRRSSGPAGPTRVYEWSKDNSEEMKKGWIINDRTIGGLARKLRIHADVLTKTIRDYNVMCEKGVDPDFGRNPLDLIPLDQPPYYAVKLWPGGANTQGGPRRSTKGEVLDTDGKPIPGLYSAGELGSVYGMLYPGAGNLAECFTFGRISGENCARRKA